ncbi:hypothetical protein [Lentzea sp. NPDC059081]|uniref:hypothetical protein n=1 Tax=Lentzea sp. NPDC059081 TaxID=3346719 RepID=UPI00369D9986
MGEQCVSNLERRYRALLTVLPAWYRRDRAEEMAGIFLAGRTGDLDQEHGWPGWGETWAVLGLAVRTHLAAGVVFTPGGQRWHGEIVRALGMIGLLVGVLHAGVSLAVPESGVAGLLPVVAFLALLAGWRTTAKVLALGAVVAGLVVTSSVGTWVLFQLPAVVTLACLCLGFHREAPTPPAGRLLWWGGGALVLGVAAGPWLGTVALVVALVVVRVFAWVRGDFVLGRALAVFAVLELVPLAVLLLTGGAVVVALVALLVVSAVAPVRKPRLS